MYKVFFSNSFKKSLEEITSYLGSDVDIIAHNPILDSKSQEKYKKKIQNIPDEIKKYISKENLPYKEKEGANTTHMPWSSQNNLIIEYIEDAEKKERKIVFITFENIY